MRNHVSYQLWDGVTPQTITSSTDANPVVVTKAAHGLTDGGLYQIFGHTTNVAVNGIWKVEVVNSSTFKLKDINTGAYVTGSGGGAGASGVIVPAPKIALVSDFTHAELSFDTSSAFNGTVKIAGSLGKPLSAESTHGDTPNFGATVSPSNPYSFVQIINLATNAGVDGATGITSAGTDLDNLYEININALKYICPIVTAWTAGKIYARLTLYSND